MIHKLNLGQNLAINETATHVSNHDCSDHNKSSHACLRHSCQINQGFRACVAATAATAPTKTEDLQQRKLAKRVRHGCCFTLKLQTHHIV
jgi:hypothetical protein